MAGKAELAELLLAHWRHIESYPQQAARCFIGFDGFTDDIAVAVQQRVDAATYCLFETIAPFTERLAQASGKSCNIELILQRRKIGGNAPLLTCALLEGGHQITFAGTIGTEETIEPLFQPMAQRCAAVIPLAPSSHSHIIEFRDGKIIFGNLTSLLTLTTEKIQSTFPIPAFSELLSHCSLIVNANWTMMPIMTPFWHYLIESVVPELPPLKAGPPRYLFVDLADPAKRSDRDLQEAMEALRQLNQSFHVVLGINRSESERLIALFTEGQRMGMQNTKEEAVAMAEELRKVTGLDQIIIHSPMWAAAAAPAVSACVDSPYTPQPAVITGAGDNFNAGFCNALLYGLDLTERLLSGVATAGYYVRMAKSPTIAALAKFLLAWERDIHHLGEK